MGDSYHKHFDDPVNENSDKKKRRKGILKNSDPNASYHKNPTNPIEELVEHELPHSSSHHRHRHSSDKESRHHRRRHGHHSKRSSSSGGGGKESTDKEEEKEKNRRNHRHHHSRRHQQYSEGVGAEVEEPCVMNGGSSSSKRDHHRSGSSKRHSGGEERSNRRGSDGTQQQQQHESDRIYDQPNVPPVKYLHAVSVVVGGDNVESSNRDSGEEVRRVYKAIVSVEDQVQQQQVHQNDLYENLQVEQQQQQVLYDVPRSCSQKAGREEALHVKEDPLLLLLGYDTPRLQQQQLQPAELQQDYDVPRLASAVSLSTIEEEHPQSEYDVPNAHHRRRVSPHNSSHMHEQAAASAAASDDYSVPKSFREIDNAFCDDLLTGNDDRSSGSSGYRSSSSPSLQSENNMEGDLDSCGSSHKNSSSSPEPLTRDVAIETTLERRPPNHLSKRNSIARSEKAREKERQRAAEIEDEVRKKMKEGSRLKSPAIAQLFDSQRFRAKSDEGFVEVTEEPTKNIMAATTALKQQKLLQNQTELEMRATATVVAVAAEKKKHQQQDRSVDVYNETMRQRVSRNEKSKLSTPSWDVFKVLAENEENEVPKVIAASTSTLQQQQQQKPNVEMTKTVTVSQNNNGDDIDATISVQQLRSRFESDCRRSSFENSSPSRSMRRGVTATVNKETSNGTSNGRNQVAIPEVRKSSRNSDFGEKSVPLPEVRFGGESGNYIKKSSAVSAAAVSRDNGAPISGSSKPTTTDKDRSPSSCDKEMILSSHSQFAVTRQAEAMRSKRSQETDDRRRWNLAVFVGKMYELSSLDEVDKNSEEQSHMEGLLDRLPQGKTNSSMWSNWKRQFFVAANGALQSFVDESKTVPLERIELFGGKVSLQKEGVLLVEDRNGCPLVLKCPNDELLQKWENAIRANISQDFSSSFVTPSPLTRSPALFSKTLVVDLGGASVRAGLASALPTLPQLFFPAVMAAEHFGFDALRDEVRTKSRLSHPLAPSHQADKYSVDQTALLGIFKKIFKDLALVPSQYEVQLSVPRNFSDNTKRAVAVMLFDELGVSAVNMAHQTTFAFYSYNAKSGIMVDLGERMDVVPVVEGYKVQSGVSRLPAGGKELRSALQNRLLGRNYSLTSFADGFLTRYAVEELGYISRQFDKELERYGKEPESIDRTLEVASPECPDAPVQRLTLGSERFETCEGLFKPELWGLDQAGVHVLVHKAIKECGVDVRREVTQNIFLAGGLTLLPGLRERLEAEVSRLTTIRPRVHASPYRYHAAYLGAAVHANSDSFRETKVTREEWNRAGAKLDKYWTM